ncbi:sensor histidine kinase [Clostridium cochlearium]|uniref:sensor histidine kinase n=1 Tax=Clostridium cochlearium TaxID=1494 RepID=UPI000B94FAC3|nr:HAMP domain-containing sensor histidine kinase [Clostridium cochlearium]MBV1819219.1 HAMP domain-containing histidine kinase [Bacteroidales bacterium MSK.15.36]MBU5269908.1 HAMP domain-containing histidine kinase [Clostridium cochlearium]MCG4581090.1 HAMP domain-containing histidine kinase [Clostridium cochlearium]SNV68339.1 sensor histidine kinase [Clostridium cochlearium]STA91707.1 sensor histidine kinase [Clostridium cochlearium]
MNNESFRILIDKKRFHSGIILIIFGVILPFFMNVNNFKIYELLLYSISTGDKSMLVIAAFRLVILNTIRGIPNYLGTFIIAESIEVYIKEKNITVVEGIIAITLIPLLYKLINDIHNIRYDLGIPASIVIISIILLKKFNFFTISFFKKSLVMVLILMGVQWMDIIPGLSKFKFGRGETSQDIKIAAELIESTELLSITSIMFCLIFIMFSILMAKLIMDEHKLIIAIEENKRVEKELAEAKIDALKARNYAELKNLVHDLKTPLTSIQALVSIIKLMEQNEKIVSYLDRIEISIDRLSNMISEILYEEKKNIISTEEMFSFILSQISPLPYSDKINYKNTASDCKIKVNKMRFARAIINALDNSYSAINEIGGDRSIMISVYKIPQNVCIEIIDDGIGIRKELIDKVWNNGFSSKKSTGFGLGFMKDVIKNHDGYIEIYSEPNKGTCIKITLPEE